MIGGPRPLPCSMNVDDICAVTVKNSTIDAHTGNIRSNIFSSSTWETVQSLHGFFDTSTPFSSDDAATMAALSKNLEHRRRVQMWGDFQFLRCSGDMSLLISAEDEDFRKETQPLILYISEFSHKISVCFRSNKKLCISPKRFYSARTLFSGFSVPSPDGQHQNYMRNSQIPTIIWYAWI